MDNNAAMLMNSRRRFEKLTYTPLLIAEPRENEPRDALGLATLVRMLQVNGAEFAQLQGHVQQGDQRAALHAMQNLTNAISGPRILAAVAALAAVPTSGFLGVAKALGEMRAEVSDTLAKGIRELDTRFLAVRPRTVSSPATRDVPSRSTHQDTTPARPGSADVAPSLHTTHGISGMMSEPPSPSRLSNLHLPSLTGAATSISPNSALMQFSPSTSLAASLASTRNRAIGLNITAQPLLSTALSPEIVARTPDVLIWAASNEPQRISSLMNIASQYTLASSGSEALLTALTMINRLHHLTDLFSDALTRRPLQPLGLLHLERLVMTPLGIERGELLYSLPLAPNEKVTLAHREWAVREEQFSEFIEDYLENFSERGVAESDDIAMSTSTETSHSNALNMSQPVAAASSVNITSPVDTTTTPSSSVEDTATKEESKSHSRTVTAKASARTIKDHKISFTVTTVAGMEDFTAHLIENKHEDKSMLIDYFRRVRKWRSELYRYGVRLTYDVVVPDPGARLRSRQLELQKIAEELATEFSLDLSPSEINVYNWENLADRYGVVLQAPPMQVRQIEAAQPVAYSTAYEVNSANDGTKWLLSQRLTSLSISVPQDYQLDNLAIFAEVSTWSDAGERWITAIAGESVNSAGANSDGYCIMNWNLGPNQVPPTGQITVAFKMRAVANGELKLTATVVPTEASMEVWRLQCWSLIRDMSYANYAQHRSFLRDRQSALLKDIASDDPLKLRRMEREQIMRSVLEWLFPGFDDASSMLANLPSPGSLDPGTWQQIMEYGEYIKFVQTAIDWDHVMVFLYPYFWDTIWHEHEKLFLDHPDSIHREFLRAGAARVIVAVQPGFENQVVSLLDHGQLGKLPDQSRFAKAIQDVQDANDAYAKTAHSGGPEEDPKEPGIIIGSWTDYTPSSALDIQVTLSQVVAE